MTGRGRQERKEERREKEPVTAARAPRPPAARRSCSRAPRRPAPPPSGPRGGTPHQQLVGSERNETVHQGRPRIKPVRRAGEPMTTAPQPNDAAPPLLVPGAGAVSRPACTVSRIQAPNLRSSLHPSTSGSSPNSASSGLLPTSPRRLLSCRINCCRAARASGDGGPPRAAGSSSATCRSAGSSKFKV